MRILRLVTLASSVLILTIVFTTVRTAEARIYVRIDEVAEKKFPLAITNLINTGERRDSKDVAHKIPDIIRKDLQLAGLFEFVESDLFPRNDLENYQPGSIDYPSWQILGVQGLVKGGFRYVDGNKIKAELFLYDPLSSQKLVAHSYKAKAHEARKIAHHFADKIMEALTGIPGIFQTELAFVSNASSSKEIYIMGVDGGGMRRITSDRNINISPDWSRSGKIAYTSFTQDGFAEIKVYSGGRSKQITRKGGLNLSPAWTPNGRFITSAVSNDEESNLFNLTMSGRVARRLTRHWGIDIGASWSPGGGSYVFASERAGGLHLFRSGGGGTQRLTFVGYQNDNPAWSPDGERIVFQGRDQGVWDLFIMNPDGSVLQRLTAGTGNNQEPSWAPNSQYIAYSSSRTGAYQVHIMTSQGENQTRIRSGGSSTMPDWGPYVK